MNAKEYFWYNAAVSASVGFGPDKASAFRETLVGEIFYALGVSRDGLVRRALGALFRGPAGRLGAIAARADAAAGAAGIGAGSRSVLGDLSVRVSARGADGIPLAGPLLVVANHPGGLDSLAILARIPRRDVHVIISDAPLTRAFEHAGRNFIYASPGAKGRAAALRTAIDRLRAGGAVLVFPRGDVEPDPELAASPAGALGEWSRSVEVMLRAAPGVRLLAAAASGALSPRYARGPLSLLRRSPERKQKLAEVRQFLAQAFRPGRLRLEIHLSFAAPVEGADILARGGMSAVTIIARHLLAGHMLALRERGTGPDVFVA